MEKFVFECLSCLVLFSSIGARSSSGSTNIADQIKAHISKKQSFCRKTFPRQLFPLLFVSHDKN